MGKRPAHAARAEPARLSFWSDATNLQRLAMIALVGFVLAGGLYAAVAAGGDDQPELATSDRSTITITSTTRLPVATSSTRPTTTTSVVTTTSRPPPTIVLTSEVALLAILDEAAFELLGRRAPEGIRVPFVERIHELETEFQRAERGVVYAVDPPSQARAMIEEWYPEEVAAHRFAVVAREFDCIISPSSPGCDDE